MARKRKPSGRQYKHGYQSRQINIREPLQRFLIICEGEKTEPAYFNGFRVPSVTIEIVGLAKAPLELVERADERQKEGDYDQVWCVFDRDQVSAGLFQQALALAQRRKILIAYSNPAFELWFLLHFHSCVDALTAHECIQRFSRQLKRPYEKAEDGLYHELLPRQAQAIAHADRLLSEYDPPNPADNNPSTTVHKLVQELNRFTQASRFAK